MMPLRQVVALMWTLLPLWLLATSTAHAADLGVEIALTPSDAQARVVFEDLAAGALPSLLLTSTRGDTWRVDLHVDELQAERVVLRASLSRVRTGRKGRTTDELYATMRILDTPSGPSRVMDGQSHIALPDLPDFRPEIELRPGGAAP